jgi:preprotein translocase subunit YajC
LLRIFSTHAKPAVIATSFSEKQKILRGIDIKMGQPMLAFQSGAAPDMLIQFAPILIIGVIFYLLIFMPMRKRQKKLEAMIGALKNGDKVITGSGIYGVIAGVKEKTFILKIADQVKIEVAKSAVSGLQGPEETQGN